MIRNLHFSILLIGVFSFVGPAYADQSEEIKKFISEFSNVLEKSTEVQEEKMRLFDNTSDDETRAAILTELIDHTNMTIKQAQELPAPQECLRYKEIGIKALEGISNYAKLNLDMLRLPRDAGMLTKIKNVASFMDSVKKEEDSINSLRKEANAEFHKICQENGIDCAVFLKSGSSK